MRRPRLVREAGPFVVRTASQNGDGTVTATLYPAWPGYGAEWMESRRDGDGGGIGMFTSMAFGQELERFLNALYDPAIVQAHKDHVAAFMAKTDAQARKRLERRFKPETSRKTSRSGAK